MGSHTVVRIICAMEVTCAYGELSADMSTCLVLSCVQFKQERCSRDVQEEDTD